MFLRRTRTCTRRRTLEKTPPEQTETRPRVHTDGRAHSAVVSLPGWEEALAFSQHSDLVLFWPVGNDERGWREEGRLKITMRACAIGLGLGVA